MKKKVLVKPKWENYIFFIIDELFMEFITTLNLFGTIMFKNPKERLTEKISCFGTFRKLM